MNVLGGAGGSVAVAVARTGVAAVAEGEGALGVGVGALGDVVELGDVVAGDSGAVLEALWQPIKSCQARMERPRSTPRA